MKLVQIADVPTPQQLEKIRTLRKQYPGKPEQFAVVPTLPAELVLPDRELYDRAQLALDARDKSTPGFQKLIREVREQVREICPLYVHCRQDDWCVLCNSGMPHPVTGEQRFFRLEEVCRSCPLAQPPG